MLAIAVDAGLDLVLTGGGRVLERHQVGHLEDRRTVEKRDHDRAARAAAGDGDAALKGDRRALRAGQRARGTRRRIEHEPSGEGERTRKQRAVKRNPGTLDDGLGGDAEPLPSDEPGRGVVRLGDRRTFVGRARDRLEVDRAEDDVAARIDDAVGDIVIDARDVVLEGDAPEGHQAREGIAAHVGPDAIACQRAADGELRAERDQRAVRLDRAALDRLNRQVPQRPDSGCAGIDAHVVFSRADFGRAGGQNQVLNVQRRGTFSSHQPVHALVPPR